MANPVETRPNPAPIVFVGGTGRSGTHVIAQLLCRNVDLALIPVETRFHCEPGGFPDLLSGKVTNAEFLKRLRGTWWKGFQTNRWRFRGMHRLLDRGHFEASVAAFDAGYDADHDGACRRLFFDLLWSRAEEKGAVGIVEQSCDTIAAGGTLARLFPEARFVHVVRDGRDSSASRVKQTRGLVSPRTRQEGLRWWEQRMTRIAAGVGEIPSERLLEVSIDELTAARGPTALHPLCRFAGVSTGDRVRTFYRRNMSMRAANQGRWRSGVSARRAAVIEDEYAAALDRLEAAGATFVPLLRRTFDRSRSANPDDFAALPYIGVELEKVA
jgi:Sulfotransferase family